MTVDPNTLDLLKEYMDTLLVEITYHDWNKHIWLKPVMDSMPSGEEYSIEKAITKGKVIKVGDRTIYPVIIFSTVEFKDKFTYESITPFALAVIEPDRKYFISLDEENEEIMELLCDDELWSKLGLEKDKTGTNSL